MTAPVPEGSLTAARLRLADAAEAWHLAVRAQVRDGRPDPVMSQAWLAFQQECEALRTKRAEG